MIMINGCFPPFFFSSFRKLRITIVSITFLLTCLESTKSIFTCWKYLQFWYFQVPPYIAYIHIVHKENRGCSCWAWILLFCSVSLFCPYIFSWEMKFFLLLLNSLQLPRSCPLFMYTTRIWVLTIRRIEKKNFCFWTEQQKRCNLEDDVHVWFCLLAHKQNVNRCVIRLYKWYYKHCYFTGWGRLFHNQWWLIKLIHNSVNCSTLNRILWFLSKVSFQK